MVTRKALERLEQLNRDSLKHPPKVERINYQQSHDIHSSESVGEPAIEICKKSAQYIALEEAAPGTLTQTDLGDFLLIKHWLSDCVDNAQKIIKSFPAVLKSYPVAPSQSQHAQSVSYLATVHPSRILFLDIETCGLSSSPLFLIGCAYFTGENFALLQLFTRHLQEERPLLSFFASLFSQYDLLVTFNGKSFDLPFILGRGTENRVPIRSDIAHLDLLFEVRRFYQSQMPNCKLQTFEKYILNRKRTGDISGSDIPQVYREFVQTGNAADIKRVLHHNILDIATMIDMIQTISDSGHITKEAVKD